MRKLLSVFAAFAMVLTILTGSIALPLLIRPFYRAQIEPLGIPARSGLTVEQIGAAFDDVMDYCLGKRPDFAAGVLSFSPGGASHFADVRRLFLLDLRVLAVCVAVLLVLYALRRKKGLTLDPLAGHSPGFWAGCGLGGALAKPASWQPWISTGPSRCSTASSFPARTTGSLTRPRTR